MDQQSLLALYDQEERINVEYSDQRREQTGTVIRHVSLHAEEAAPRGFVLYSRLTEANVEQAIQEQLDYFGGLGASFGWKSYDHDTPADLRDRLAAHGFVVDEAEAIMVLELDQAPPELLAPVTQDVHRITDPGLVDSVVAVQDEALEGTRVDLASHLRRTLTDHPELLSVHAIYADGRPVSSAWLRFDARSPFASLWGGSTLAAYRKRGFYTALLAVRVQEAIRRGARFLSIDASPMSRPIVERFGFRLITTAYDCNWDVKPKA